MAHIRQIYINLVLETAGRVGLQHVNESGVRQSAAVRMSAGERA
jgi:hypothetical protein